MIEYRLEGDGDEQVDEESTVWIQLTGYPDGNQSEFFKVVSKIILTLNPWWSWMFP